MATGALLDAWLAFSRANTRLQQFGQADDETTFNGATGCTHTVLQRLVKAKTGTYYTPDQISSIASYPTAANNPNRRGMYSGGSDNEAGRVISKFALPYRIVFGLTWAQVMAYAPKGPIMLAVRYGYWPEDKGFVYKGVTADGKPGGFAYRNGKTQLSGAEQIYHASLFLGQAPVAGAVMGYANEPNHGSASRPEKPDYDMAKLAYIQRAYQQYGSSGRSLLAWVPTTTFKPKGY